MSSIRTQLIGGPSTGFVGSTAVRRASKTNAHRLKAAGGASNATGTRESAIGDLGGAIGEALGGESGAGWGTAIGEALNRLLGGGDSKPHSGQSGQQFTANGGPCGPGRISMGGKCVDPSAILPGGEPFVAPGGGAAVMGAFGMPAQVPSIVVREVRKCMKGMVLGKDNLCYPKGILTRRSKYRKHRRPPRPPVSAADMKAIRRAARAKDRVASLGKDVGLHVSKTRGKSRKQIEQEIRLEILDRD